MEIPNNPSPASRGRLPAWVTGYRRDWFAQDALAGLVVAFMLVPQCLAYAVLAGLPAQVGLYASILPLIAYAVFGSSMTMAVGPHAIIALMTAAAIGPLAAPGSTEYTTLAVTLALLTGAALMVFGVLRLGFLSQLLSQPVISGFVSGSAALIAVGQVGPLLGIVPSGHTAIAVASSIVAQIGSFNPATLALGAIALPLFWSARGALERWLARAGVPAQAAKIFARAVPLLALLLATAVVAGLDLDVVEQVAVVGSVPGGLPVLRLELPAAGRVAQLLIPALAIGLIGFVGNVSIGQSLARRRMERIDANAELRALGAVNLASAISGGFPVAGSLSRSALNFAAGARTPLAGVVCAVLMTLVLVSSTGTLERVPRTVLAATIIVAVIGLIDFATLRRSWNYDRADALAWLGTAIGVLGMGVEAGISIGIGLSLTALLWRSSRPHIAVIGRVPGTEHFRNVSRHAVEVDPAILALRLDENLHFGNVLPVDEQLRAEMARHPMAHHLLLELSSVNHIDVTALDMLEGLNRYALAQGWQMHLSEVRGPVLDKLRGTALLAEVTHASGGTPFLSTYHAFVQLGSRDADAPAPTPD